MKLPPDQLISEVLQRVSSAKTKDEKITILRNYDSPALRAVFIWNFHQKVESALPPVFLHKSEAEVLCHLKDKELHKKYRITKSVVQEAFPDIVWE
jgi:hypothetical protein